jgi:peroxiredoxin
MTTASIAEQVSALRAGRPPRPEGEALNPFEQEQARLAASALPEGVITPGSTLGDIELLDVHGAATTLYAAIGGRDAVIAFYRGAWCPYCNIALWTYQTELLPGLVDRGVALIAISPQKPDGSLTMEEKNTLSFTVLSDPGNQLARQVGIVTAPSADALATQLSRGMDLREHNADGTAELPMPTTLILGWDRVVRWVDVHPDYTTRSEPADILVALDSSR